MAGRYKTKLTRSQVESALVDARVQFTPQLAKAYGLTIGEACTMLVENNMSNYIQYKKYGSKRYSRDEKTKQIIKSYWEQGLSDDEIAQKMETTCPTIARLRSTFGLVAFKRIVTKGHKSKRINSHIKTNQQSSIVQGSLFDSVDQSTVKQDYLIHRNGGVDIIKHNDINKNDQDMLLMIDSSLTKDEAFVVNTKLNTLVTWRRVCQRMIDNRYYRIDYNNKIYLFNQIQVDPYNKIVQVKLVEVIKKN